MFHPFEMNRISTTIPLLAYLLGVLWLMSGTPVALAAGGSAICTDKKQHTGYWRVWPRGEVRYGGTPAVLCMKNEYEEISGSGIQRYKCKEGFASCTPSTTYEITGSKQNKDGTTTLYWKNKKDSFYKGSMAFYETGPPVTPGAKKEDPAPPRGRLVDPWEGYPRGAAMEDYWGPDVTAAWLEHYVNTKNNSNACTHGDRFASYMLRYRRDFKVEFDLVNQALINPLVQGDRDFMGQNPYDPSIWKTLDKQGVVHCFKIVHPDNPARWARKDRLHGEIVSPQTAIRYRIEGGKVVDMMPLKACCDAEKGACLGLVPWNTSCPKGESVPGALGNGQFTNCSVCAKEQLPVEEKKPEQTKTESAVGCCRDGQCKPSPSGLSCALSGGEPLEPERACPASGPDPCRATPPPPAPSLKQKPGACLFKSKPCQEMASAEACRKSPGYVIFLEGTSCEVKRGGCCDGINPCFTATLGDCLGKGEFFEGGCPATCPPQKGSCTQLCEATNEELCQDTTKAECAAVDGAVFAPGGKCIFRSATLQCPPVSDCDSCAYVIGRWSIDEGDMYFARGCRGLFMKNPELPPIPFNYACKGEREITVTYGTNKPPLKLQLVDDGENFRTLLKR